MNPPSLPSTTVPPSSCPGPRTGSSRWYTSTRISPLTASELSDAKLLRQMIKDIMTAKVDADGNLEYDTNAKLNDLVLPAGILGGEEGDVDEKANGSTGSIGGSSSRATATLTLFFHLAQMPPYLGVFVDSKPKGDWIISLPDEGSP
ncbi:hypothetical protein PG985_010400 [Apiospora marii]|uniref:uncharacterized protein n=1 Tax=Apiospora marii TaxID=335849 RepID=UPI00312F8AED